jgi:hypothetical protein
MWENRLFRSLHPNLLSFVFFGFALVVIPALNGCGGGSSPVATPPPATAPLVLSVSPSALSVVPGSTITLMFTAGGGSGAPSLTSAQLPSGFSLSGTLPLAIPSGGVRLNLQMGSTLSAGPVTLTFNAQAGSSTTSFQIPVTILATTPPNFQFDFGAIFELQVPIGGSGQTQIPTVVNYQGDYNVVISLSGLPSGVTSTVTPSTILPGQPITVTLTASSTAPPAQNVPVVVTGTPQAPVGAGTETILVDVTPQSSSLPENRTDYLSTEGTPYGATHDSTHNLIFSSNPSWNQVDVISNVTHAIIEKVDVPTPRGIDISQDGSTVWVATASQQVFAIDTSTFAAKRYVLPQITTGPGPAGSSSWIGYQLLALDDGSVMVFLAPNDCCSYLYLADWNPSSGTFAQLTTPSSESLQNFEALRSGDGKEVWFFGSTSDEPTFYYNVPTKTFSAVTNLAGYALVAAVNHDGSRIAIGDLGSGLNMYDRNLNLIGSISGGGVIGGGQFQGGMTFSPVTGDLYETAMPTDIPVTFTIDPNTLNVLAVAPAMGIVPAAFLEMSPPFYMASPFAVDATGVVLGVQDFGIAFDDSTFAENFLSSQLGPCNHMNHMSPYAGPLAGGTTSGGFGCSFPPMTPGVWYGPNRGTAINTIPVGPIPNWGELTIVSPSGTSPGPVNIKLLFPDGTQIFDPLFFSYGPFIRYATLSGASPDGGAPGMIDGFGLPSPSNGGTVSVGGSAGQVNSLSSLFSSPFPSSGLGFTVPAGSPGWTDITVKTPDGSFTAPKAFFYAESVTDYSSPDTFTAILYDSARQQLYLSAGDHIDVFSLSANQFVSPLTPPAQGASKQFTGLALTPDGSELLAANLLDGSLAVINPDNPSGGYAISIAPSAEGNPGCSATGPLYVASTVGNQAFVTTGGYPGVNCEASGNTYVVNLTSKASTLATCCRRAYSVASSADGTEVVIAGGNLSVYHAAQQSLSSTGASTVGTGAISADGNVVAQQSVFADAFANLVGQVGSGEIRDSGQNPTGYIDGLNLNPLSGAQLSASGSLYFVPYSNSFDIDDVRQGRVRLRFSLNETLSNIVEPLATDSGGQHVYLLTDKGLTIVDLGEALLSIGSVNPTSASPGTVVTVRGSGFNASTTATVGGQAALVSSIDENTLTFTVPAIPSGPVNIALQNSDGTTYTLQNGLTVP